MIDQQAIPVLERRREECQFVGNPIVKLDAGQGEPLACFVWDISERGARLKLAQPVDLPVTVAILIGNVRKSGRVVWRRDDQVGIEFLPEA